MAVTREQVAKLYVANFNRAPDKAGLDYWISDGTDATTALTDVNAIARAMQAGAEAEELTAMSDADYCVALYSQLFGRDVDAENEGIVYWVTELEAGNVDRANMIQTLIAGAEAGTGSADDAAVLANKTEVGLYYADTLELDGTDFSLETITSDTATVTTAKTSADEILNPPTPEGETFALTTSDDPVTGTAYNDTITGATGTISTGDLIVDNSTEDNDTLNLTFTDADTTANPQPTITGIENININIDAFDGTTTTLDAVNITGSTITLSSSKLGFNGRAGVENVGANNVTAGENINTLIATGVKSNSLIDATTVTGTVNVQAATTSDTLNIKIGSDVSSIFIGTSAAPKSTVLEVTANTESDVNINNSDFGSSLSVIGSGDITLMTTSANMTGKTITNDGTGTLTLKVSNDADANVKNIEASTIEIIDTYSSDLTIANNQYIKALGTLENGAKFIVDSTDDAESITIDLLGSATADTVDLTDIEETTININVSNTTIGAIDATGNKVIFTGEGNVSVATAVTGAEVDFSALDGRLAYTTTDGATQTIKGALEKTTLTTSSGGGETITFVGQDTENVINANITDGTLSVETGSGVDKITVAAALTGKIVGTLGAGDDVVTINGNTSTGQITIDGGEGDSDKIVLLDSAHIGNLTTTSSLTNFEIIELGTAGGTSVNIDSALLTGQTLTIEGSAGTDALTINSLKSTIEYTVDLSSISFDAVESITVYGNINSDIITGISNATGITETLYGDGGNDTIIAGIGSGDDIIYGQAGDDTIDLTGATGVNTVYLVNNAGKDTILGWGSNDVINVEGTTVTGNIAAESAETVGAQETVSATLTAYIMSTNGTAANLTTGGTAVVDDWLDRTEIAAYLGERFAVTGDEEAIFVINDTTSDANTTYIYELHEQNDTTIDAGELTLIGVVENGGVALTVANIDFTA